VVGLGAPQAAAPLIDALAAQPTLQGRVVAAVRVGERRWNLRMNNGMDVLLPEGAEAQALAKLVELQASHALLDRPLQALDLRLPDRLVVRPLPDPSHAPPPPRKPV
jgi:cell division protein FtsQ